MKIEIDIQDDILGYSASDEKGNDIHFENLKREEQIKILNAFSQGYNFFVKFLKEDTK